MAVEAASDEAHSLMLLQAADERATSAEVARPPHQASPGQCEPPRGAVQQPAVGSSHGHSLGPAGALFQPASDSAVQGQQQVQRGAGGGAAAAKQLSAELICDVAGRAAADPRIMEWCRSSLSTSTSDQKGLAWPRPTHLMRSSIAGDEHGGDGDSDTRSRLSADSSSNPVAALHAVRMAYAAAHASQGARSSRHSWQGAAQPSDASCARPVACGSPASSAAASMPWAPPLSAHQHGQPLAPAPSLLQQDAQRSLEQLQAKHAQLWRQYERSAAVQAQLEARCGALEAQVAAGNHTNQALRAHCAQLQADNGHMAAELTRLRPRGGVGGAGGLDGQYVHHPHHLHQPGTFREAAPLLRHQPPRPA